MPQNSTKTFFLVAPDHFFLRNGPNDMVKGLFSSLIIGTYILLTCGALHTFFSPFWGAQMPQNSIRRYVLYYLSYKNGHDDLVRGLLSSLDVGTYGFVDLWTYGLVDLWTYGLVGLWVAFWVYLGVPKCPKTANRNYFLVVLDYFSYTNEPNYLFSGFFLSLDIGTYIPPTCGPFCTSLGPFGGPQMLQSGMKKNF
jgi:hypothetical protein